MNDIVEQRHLPPVTRWLLVVVGVFTVLSPFAFDFNATHIFNPRWPPHAKFHDGQTILLGAWLGTATIMFAWRRGQRTSNALAAFAFASAYWVTQLLAVLFPGARYIDPEFDKPAEYVLGLPGNVFANLIVLGVLTVAAVPLARRGTIR